MERGSRLTSGPTGVTSEAVIKHLSSSHKILCKRRVTSCRAQDDGLKKCVGSRIKQRAKRKRQRNTSRKCCHSAKLIIFKISLFFSFYLSWDNSETIPFFPPFLHNVASNKRRGFLISARMFFFFPKISVVDHWTFKPDFIGTIGSWIILDTNIWFRVYIEPGLCFLTHQNRAFKNEIILQFMRYCGQYVVKKII